MGSLFTFPGSSAALGPAGPYFLLRACLSLGLISPHSCFLLPYLLFPSFRWPSFPIPTLSASLCPGLCFPSTQLHSLFADLINLVVFLVLKIHMLTVQAYVFSTQQPFPQTQGLNCSPHLCTFGQTNLCVSSCLGQRFAFIIFFFLLLALQFIYLEIFGLYLLNMPKVYLFCFLLFSELPSSLTSVSGVFPTASLSNV